MPSSDSAEDRPERAEEDLHPEIDEGEVVDGQLVRPATRPRHGSRRLDVGWQESRYTSPLPSPDDLERYKELLPDAPERLMAAGEREQAHRHQIENRLAGLDESAMPKFYAGQRRGHYISLILGLGYELVMLVAILEGYAVEGVFGAAVGIGAMVWAARRDTGAVAPPQVEERGAAKSDSGEERTFDGNDRPTDEERSG